MDEPTRLWRESIRETAGGYRQMIDAASRQLTDEEFFRRPSPEVNSVAVILRHLGGNLRSRWTDFLTSDGEKPDRDRDAEFADWPGDRTSLLEYFDAGWSCLVSATDQITAAIVSRVIMIRGESHTLPQAFARSLTHVAYHAGQVALVARTVHQGTWQWLTVAPEESKRHNETTWGSSASRSIFGPASHTDSAGP